MPATAHKTKVFRLSNGRLTKEALQACAEAVERGGVIIFPTDTVYGIGCNAFHPQGIEKIYRIKGRSYKKALPILLASGAQLRLVAHEVLAETSVLIDSYWPGALTLVFKTAPIALHAARGKQTIAVRVPASEIVRDLLAAVGVPLATTSANDSGKPAMTNGAQVKKKFFGKVDVIVDGGECPVGEASSVIDVTHVPFTVIREGAISKAELVKKLGLG